MLKRNRDFNDHVRDPGSIEEAIDQPIDLATVHKAFAHWLGKDYDLATLDAMLSLSPHRNGCPAIRLGS
jgi:hypothetical protein